MKVTVLFLIALAISSALFAESPAEVAVRTIREYSPLAYNPKDKSEAEVTRAAEFNSQLRLRFLLLSEGASDELRVCFALRLIHERLQLAEAIRSGTQPLPDEISLMRDRDILAAFFRHTESQNK